MRSAGRERVPARVRGRWGATNSGQSGCNGGELARHKSIGEKGARDERASAALRIGESLFAQGTQGVAGLYRIPTFFRHCCSVSFLPHAAYSLTPRSPAASSRALAPSGIRLARAINPS